MQATMPFSTDASGSTGLAPFIALVGEQRWRSRLAEIRDLAASGRRAGQAVRQRHGVELILEKLRRDPGAMASATEALLGQYATEIPVIAAELKPRGQDRLIEALHLGLSGENTLIPVFHLIRTALTHRARGFTVAFPGLDDETAYDLLLTRAEISAEVACDVVTAEE